MAAKCQGIFYWHMTSIAEWRRFWLLPLVAACGVSASGLASYMTGAFMRPLHDAFGWTHAQLAMGISIYTIGQAPGTLIMGGLVDRFGPRRIGIAGALLLPAGVALLGTATGSIYNWVALWLILTVCSYAVMSLVWSSAVVSRFEVGRGFALAAALSGASVTAAVAPLLATWLISRAGWRWAFVELGVIWAAVIAPP